MLTAETACLPSLCMCLWEFWPAKDLSRVFNGPPSTFGLSNHINISTITLMNSEENAMSWDTRRWNNKSITKNNHQMFYENEEFLHISNTPYLVEMKLAHQRTGERMAAVHWQDNRPCMSRGEQGCDSLKEPKCQASVLDLTLLGPHQLLSQGLLQGQRVLAGRGGVPTMVYLHGEYLKIFTRQKQIK